MPVQRPSGYIHRSAKLYCPMCQAVKQIEYVTTPATDNKLEADLATLACGHTRGAKLSVHGNPPESVVHDEGQSLTVQFECDDQTLEKSDLEKLTSIFLNENDNPCEQAESNLRDHREWDADADQHSEMIRLAYEREDS